MDPAAANERMVEQLIVQGALWSPAVIAAFRATPRHRFLDRVFVWQKKHERWREVITRDPGPRELEIVYADRAWITHLSKEEPRVPVSSSSQPSLMAQMLEDLGVRSGRRVLEIGAGTGYNAALLAHLAGPEQVTSLEVDRNVVSEAWDHLRGFADRQVHLFESDGRLGFAERAPFDRIMVTAATPDLEPAWLEQLAAEGLLLAPLDLATGLAYLVRGTVRDGVFHGRLTRPAYFLALRPDVEYAARRQGASEPAAADVPLQTRPAPWADWFTSKPPRLRWLGFIQALAFFGWLHNLRVHYRVSELRQPVFGLSQDDAVCWLTPVQWHFAGAGRDLGWGLYGDFLDAGGPWPTEYEVRAWPRRPGDASPPGRFVRPGPCCWQVWQPLESRERSYLP